MNETLIGIVIGALITFILNYFLEKSKNKMLLNKHLFEIKREKLESFYSLIDGSVNFSLESSMKMYGILYHGKDKLKENNFKYNVNDFNTLSNLINMYFSENIELIKLNKIAKSQYDDAVKSNEKIIFNQYTNKDDMRIEVVEKWKLFGDTMLKIKEEIPNVFKSL